MNQVYGRASNETMMNIPKIKNQKSKMYEKDQKVTIKLLDDFE